ncbi:MAG: SH3 domain-containing protein [Janthinobacterium lividum]
MKPAPRTPVQSAPLVKPKPGAPVQHGRTAHPAARPGSKPAAKPAAPAVVPVPVPEPEAEKPSEPAKGSNTGAPLPRFAALRSDEVNLRTGPGTRYPIEWLYKRRDLPVLIEREFEVWRLIRDQEGIKGWVNQAVLAPRRTGVVTGAEHMLRRDARDDGAVIARLKPGVIVRLRSCDATSDWCQASVQDYRGWIKRADIWGVFPNEAIQ